MVAAHHNPFRVQRLDALRFRDLRGDDGGAIAEALLELRRGAIVGPHGSGKTTLLDAVETRARARGLPVRRVQLRRERGAVRGDLHALLRDRPCARSVVLLDSAGCLSWLDRWRVAHACRDVRTLLLTSHRRGLIATAYRTDTSTALLRQLLADLVEAPAPYEARAVELLSQHRGDLRATFRALYDLAARGALPVAEAQPAHAVSAPTRARPRGSPPPATP